VFDYLNDANQDTILTCSPNQNLSGQFHIDTWRREMKKLFYPLLFILLALSLSNCQNTNVSQLEATNEALSNQVNTLVTQLTQAAASPSKPTQAPASTSTESIAPTEIPLPSPSPLPKEEAGVIAPTLIYAGSGEITPWSNQKAYQAALFGTANLHLICDPSDTNDGKVWIDKDNYSMGCPPNSESWLIWKPGITAGDHYIYSQNSKDQYEFWTVGTTPFKITNKYAYSDFIFMISRVGIYKLTGDVLSGSFNLYLTCEKAQNFSYTDISEAMTAELVLNPAGCELQIRNQPPGTLTPGEIEVSLEFVK